MGAVREGQEGRVCHEPRPRVGAWSSPQGLACRTEAEDKQLAGPDAPAATRSESSPEKRDLTEMNFLP